MPAIEEYHDLERYQDVLGQLPILQSYTQAVYFFPKPFDVPREQIVRDIHQAITKVRKEVPWASARVINVGKEHGDSGIYRVVACSTPQPPLITVDLSDDFPQYSLIQERKAPLSLIRDGRLLTTILGFPYKIDVDSDEEPAYCLRLQVNFIKDGVLLGFSLFHTIADAQGLLVIINMLSMAMRGEDFPKSTIEAANRDRRGAIPLLGTDEPLLDHSSQIRSPVTVQNPLAASRSSRQARNHIFRFVPAALAAIKELASQKEGFDQAVPFISTDDALCAFYWQRLTRARRHRFPSETPSRFTRQMDGRQLIGLPPEYTGVVSHTAICTLSFETLTNAPISTVASALRRALNNANTPYHLRSIATLIASTVDKSTITYTGNFDPNTDVGSSSWRRFDNPFPEFGSLGRPEFLRRPPTLPFPGSIVLYPSPDGSCDANACLTDEDFAALNTDDEWNEFVEYIG